MNLAVRISRSYDEIMEWCDNIEAEKVVVYEHEADDEISRTHVHMLLVVSKCKPDALKTRFKKLYGDIDKTDWSFKKAEDEYDKFITYMSKGKLPPKLCKGIEYIEVEKLRDNWVEPKTMVRLENGRFVKDINAPTTKTKIELLEQMRSQLSGTDTTRTILKCIRKVLIANKCVIGQYKMMDYYDSLIMYSDKEEWLSGMERKINSRQGI